MYYSLFNNRDLMNYIEEDEYQLFIKRELPTKQIETDDGSAPYFTEYIRRKLEIIDEELNINLYKDGIVVHTTLDSRIQIALEAAFNSSMKKNQELKSEYQFLED